MALAVAPADAAAPVAAPPDAGAIAAPPDAAVVAVAKPPKPNETKPPKPKVDEPKPGPDPEDDESVAETLVNAQTALANGDLELAGRLANIAVNRGGPRQRAQGSTVKGLIACERRDLEMANAALNNLQGRPAMRKRVIAKCREKGLDVR